MLRFSLFGFPIAIHWFFWLNSALLSGHLFEASSPEQLQTLFFWMLAAVLSILIHELGHAFAIRRYGGRAHILLYALGGLAIPDRVFRRGQDIVISLAGPLTQLAVGLAARFLIRHSTGDADWVQLFYRYFVHVSIWWALLNLLPIYPLDGGHVLHGILGPGRHQTTMWTGAITAAAVGFYLFQVNGSLFALLLFGLLAWQNVQRARGEKPPSFLRGAD